MDDNTWKTLESLFPAPQDPQHVPWTLSSDGRGRVTVVLGTSYGTSMEMNIPFALDDDGWSEEQITRFLTELVSFNGDLVGMCASGDFKRGLKAEAVALLGFDPDDSE